FGGARAGRRAVATQMGQAAAEQRIDGYPQTGEFDRGAGVSPPRNRNGHSDGPRVCGVRVFEAGVSESGGSESGGSDAGVSGTGALESGGPESGILEP